MFFFRCCVTTAGIGCHFPRFLFKSKWPHLYHSSFQRGQVLWPLVVIPGLSFLPSQDWFVEIVHVASVVLLLLGVVSYIVGLANTLQDWFPWIQGECFHVTVLQDVGFPHFLWLFVEGLPLKTAAFALQFNVCWCPRLPGQCLNPINFVGKVAQNFSQANRGPLSCITEQCLGFHLFQSDISVSLWQCSLLCHEDVWFPEMF